MKDFESILASLNTKQREAVDTIYGPVLVIAGPGSGKTQLLSARIANILRTTDYLPSNILCLTFTENAAKNMRERLASMIGHDAYRVAIHTFHSFGNEILTRFRYLSREYSDAKAIDIITSSRILDDILERLPWNHPYKPGFRASDTIKEVLGSIENLKKGGVTPTLYRIILEKNRRDITLISPLLEKYWERIDTLGQKKEDKIQKNALFREFGDSLGVIEGEIENIGGYESFLTLFKRNVNDCIQSLEETSTKPLTAWRDAWTEKGFDGKRRLKETGKLEKQLALADIFETYQNTLSERGFIDFSDMILEAIRLMESHEVVRMSLAEMYQFIMIDEFQDTNEAQMRLIHTIASVGLESPNIFAVGDDDQSIYKFQGANTKNIRDFHDRYRDTKLIILEENYRSKSEIIDYSRTVINQESNNIGNIFSGAEKKFSAVRQDGGKVERRKFSSELEEISWIIEDIESRIRAGVSPNEVAIITKKNKTLELFAKGLLVQKREVALSKDESLFGIDEIRLIINILKLLSSLQGSYREEDSSLIVSILAHPCFEIPRLTLWELSKNIYHARKDETKSWIENLRHHDDSRIRDIGLFLIDLSLRSRTERLEDIIDTITGANNLVLPEEDEGILREEKQLSLIEEEKREFISPLYVYFFGQLSNIKGAKYAYHLANIRKFVETVRSYKNGKVFLTLSDAIEIIGLIEKYNLDISVSHLIGNESNAINLITVYKAKGLEWSHVYVPSVTESEYKMGRINGSILPKNLPLEAEKDEDEDRERLIYTAFTRAKDTLTVSYSEKSLSEKIQNPVSCLEIEDALWEETTTVPLSALGALLEVEKKELFALPYLGYEKDFLEDRIQKQFVMNATALQTFLNVADAGPETFVSNTLLRFPQAKNIAASYGSAIHKGLEDFFTDYTNNGTFIKQLLFDSFEKSLKREGFPEKVESDYLQRGLENLDALYSEITGASYGELSLEYDFRAAYGGVFLDDASGAIQLTGKIDRVERLADDTLIITDYKTGGGFDSFDGRGAEYEKIKQWKYRLQLSFYAILFELSPRWRMFEKKQYELFFVEKNQKENRFHRVKEYIQPGEIERTKQLIRKAMTKIRNLDFPDISHYPRTLEGIRMFEEDLLNNII